MVSTNFNLNRCYSNISVNYNRNNIPSFSSAKLKVRTGSTHFGERDLLHKELSSLISGIKGWLENNAFKKVKPDKQQKREGIRTISMDIPDRRKVLSISYQENEPCKIQNCKIEEFYEKQDRSEITEINLGREYIYGSPVDEVKEKNIFDLVKELVDGVHRKRETKASSLRQSDITPIKKSVPVTKKTPVELPMAANE